MERIAVTVNGREEVLLARLDEPLVDVLRRELRLSSVREACGIGMCGSCTVTVEGRIVSGCLTLMGQVAGAAIETVDVLERNGQLDLLQETFVAHNAFQCSYCTPGFLLAARELLATDPAPTRHTIRESLSGNLCRCGSYLKIEEAVLDAAERLRLLAATNS